jgi:hypothetical protein
MYGVEGSRVFVMGSDLSPVKDFKRMGRRMPTLNNPIPSGRHQELIGANQGKARWRLRQCPAKVLALAAIYEGNHRFRSFAYRAWRRAIHLQSARQKLIENKQYLASPDGLRPEARPPLGHGILD